MILPQLYSPYHSTQLTVHFYLKLQCFSKCCQPFSNVVGTRTQSDCLSGQHTLRLRSCYCPRNSVSPPQQPKSSQDKWSPSSLIHHFTKPFLHPMHHDKKISQLFSGSLWGCQCSKLHGAVQSHCSGLPGAVLLFRATEKSSISLWQCRATSFLYCRVWQSELFTPLIQKLGAQIHTWPLGNKGAPSTKTIVVHQSRWELDQADPWALVSSSAWLSSCHKQPVKHFK